MYRIISFIAIFSFVAILLYFHQQNSHHAYGFVSGHHELEIEVPPNEDIPSVEGSVHQDLSGSWYVRVETDDFTFTPERVGMEEIYYNEGHAHLYLNGEKLNRLYGKFYNLDYLDPGTYTVKVTLHAHNHGLLVDDGEAIGFEEDFVVE